MLKQLSLELSSGKIDLRSIQGSAISLIKTVPISNSPTTLEVDSALLKLVDALGSAQEVLVDDAWCRYFTVAPPANAGKREDLVFASKRRFSTLFDDLDAWTIKADWHARAPFIACAVRNSMLSVLQTSKASRQCIVPGFVARWNRHHKMLPKHDIWAISLSGDDGVVVGSAKNGTLFAILQIQASRNTWTTPTSVDRFLRQVEIRLSTALPKNVFVFGLPSSGRNLATITDCRTRADSSIGL